MFYYPLLKMFFFSNNPYILTKQSFDLSLPLFLGGSFFLFFFPKCWKFRFFFDLSFIKIFFHSSFISSLIFLISFFLNSFFLTFTFLSFFFWTTIFLFVSKKTLQNIPFTCMHYLFVSSFYSSISSSVVSFFSSCFLVSFSSSFLVFPCLWLLCKTRIWKSSALLVFLLFVSFLKKNNKLHVFERLPFFFLIKKIPF